MIKKGHTLINVISTVTLQIITLLSGFIIPKLILDAFGSEVNGLVTSVTQFLGYISLIEGGVSAVILANLYKPLANGDNQKVSAVVATASGFFRKIAIIFCVYQAVLMAVYPFIVNSQFSFGYIATMVLILGMSTIIQYSLALSWRLLLQADKRMYIAVLAQGIAVIMNLVLSFVMIRLDFGIHIVKLVSGAAFILQPLILNGYIRKNYKLDKKAKSDLVLLSQRWDGFGINVASMIRASTATVVLSIFTDLTVVSVFSVYMLVANGLRSLISSISGGIVPNIGNSYAKGDMKATDKTFNIYELIMFLVSFFAFTVAAMAMPSFALLYTKGLDDANYNQPLLGLLLMATECIFCIREPYINMAYSAGHFKQVSKFAYIEAAATAVFCVAFTLLWGINGAALALLIGSAYRTFCQVFYLKNNLINRKLFLFFKKFIVFGLASVVCVTACSMLFSFSQPQLSVIGWVIYAVKVSAVEVLCLGIACIISCQKELKQIFSKLKKAEV